MNITFGLPESYEVGNDRLTVRDSMLDYNDVDEIHYAPQACGDIEVLDYIIKAGKLGIKIVVVKGVV